MGNKPYRWSAKRPTVDGYYWLRWRDPWPDRDNAETIEDQARPVTINGKLTGCAFLAFVAVGRGPRYLYVHEQLRRSRDFIRFAGPIFVDVR